MMDHLVANLLNQYLGKYIQNLESENLNVGIFRGEVELTDLQLRPEALFELQLPVEVKAGVVGKIRLTIPWTSLYTSPVTVVLEDVYILVGPIGDRKYNAVKDAAQQNAIKRQKLEALENPQDETKDGTSGEDQGFMEKLMATVVNNIQISVHRIHIRYEDNVTNRQHPFSCGVMLKKLTAETTNGQWKTTQIDGGATRIHKLVQLNGLSLYWNPYLKDHSMVRNHIHTTVWRNLLKNSIDSYTIKEQELDFIIRPVSATCKMVLNKDSLSVMPRVIVDFTLDDIEVLVSRLQFLNVLSLGDSMRMMAVNQRYRKYSPGLPVSGHAPAWWKYAYTAIVEDTIRPYSWERISRVRQRYRQYKDVYKQHLRQPNKETIMNQLRHLEDDLDITNILVAREHAKLEFTQEAPDLAHKKTVKKGWWERLWDGEEEEEIVVHTKLAASRLSWLDHLTPEEREKLYNAVGYDENENIEHIPQYVAHKLNLCLTSCSVSLVNYGKEVLKVSVSNMITSFENRPDSGGFGASAKTESFVVEGVSIERELIPVITSDIGVYAPSKVSQVFSVEFEKRPLQLEADFAIRVNVQPVEMVYDEHAVTEVIAFFQVPNISVKDMKKMAQAGLDRFTSISRAGLQYAIQQHKTMHVSVNMRSPYVVIPEYGTLHRGGNVIVVDFGKLKVESELQPKNISLEECTLSEIESRLYDKFNITITEVKALLADSGEDWHTAQTRSDSEYHVLPSVGMQLAFFNTVKNDYTRLPQQKVEAKLPTLKLNLSDEKIHMFANFFKRLPMPHSNSMMGLEDTVDGAIHIEPLPSIMDEKEVQREPSLQELTHMRRSVLRNSVVRHDPMAPHKKKVRVSVRSSDSEYFSASDHSDEEGQEWAKNVTAPTVDDQTSATNVIRLLARFTLGEVLVQVSKSADRIDTPYLMFRVNRLCADAAITSYGLALQASLGGIELVDKIHLSSSGEYLEVLSSKSDSDLISVVYRKVEPECPDFENVYGRVEQTMLVQMSSLHMMFDRAAVLYLNTFVQGLLLSVQGGMDRGMQKSTSTVLSGQAEQSEPDAPTLLQRLTSQMEDDVTTGATQLHLVAKLDDLQMKLCDHENDFAEIKAKGLEGTVIKKALKVTLHLKLSDFSIDDLTENTLYPRLLVIEDDEVFDFKFVSYTKPCLKMDAISKTRTAVDMSVRLRIGRLQGTLLYKFISEIKNFMDPFMNPEVTKAYRLAAKKAINNKIQDVQEQGTRIRLAVDIKAPSVLVPQNSESTSVIVLKLGDLHVTNSFEGSEVGGVTQKWDHMYLKLEAVKVIRGKLNMNGYIEHVHTIVDPTNLRLDLKRALPPIQTDCTHDLSGHLHMIKIQVTQLDLKVVMAILHENFSETSNRPASIDDADLSPQLTDNHILVTQDSTDTQMACLESVEPLLATPDASEIIKQTRFMFVMDGTQLRLLQEAEDPLVMTSPGQEDIDGLSQFETGKLDVSGQLNNDGSLEVDLCLKSVSLDDVREHSNLAVKRLIQASNHVRSKYDTAPPMFHINYKQDAENNRYIDINLEMVRVNLCVAYLMTVAHFLTDALQMPEDMNRSKVKAKKARMSVRRSPAGDSAGQNSVRPALTVSGRFKKPEIVLFAKPDDAHSRVLILKASGIFDYSSHLGRTQMEAKVKQLQMFSGYYGLAQQTASMVLHPCDLEFTQSQEAPEAELKVTLTMSDISLHISATTLHIFFDVMDIINEDRKMELLASNAVATNNAEYFDLWTTNNISSQKWLSTEDESDQGPKYPVWPVGAVVESLTVAVKQVHMLFEVENKDYQVPRLSVRTGLHATMHDWSKQMHGELSLSLDISCYNDQLAVWEPLLEPVMKQEDVYKPWELIVKFVQAESLPISCEFDSVEAGKKDDIDGDIHYLLCRARAHSDSSEMETDSDNEMTVIQSKRNRQASDRSHDSASRHNSSIQGDSDSETEVISTISTNLDSMLSSDSSDIEFSDDDAFEEADKPVFLTARGPIRVDSEIQEEDMVDGPGEKRVAEMCTYILIDSRDDLSISLTPHAIDIIMTVSKTLMKSDDTLLQSVHDLPGFEVFNQLGIGAKISLCPELRDIVVNPTWVEERPDMVQLLSQLSTTSAHNVVVTSGGQEVQHKTKDDETDLDLDDIDGLSFISRALAQTANTVIGAGAFVFDPNYDADNDHHSNMEIQKGKMNLKLEGFEELFNLSHRKAAASVVQLIPPKGDTNYCVVVDVAVTHGRKVVTVRSPLQLHNHMDVSMVIYCNREQLQRHGAGNLAQGEAGQFSRLHTLAPGQVYDIPLYVAYHCTLYAAPEGLGYEKTMSPIWWQELSTARDKNQYFSCPSHNQGEKPFIFKVTCEEGSEARRPDLLPHVIPYYSLHCYAPVILHNLLPYDIEFSLQEVGVNSLSHGENMPLYMADLSKTPKLQLQLSDYLGLDWSGSVELSTELEQFKAINMECDNSMKAEHHQLSVSVHVTCVPTMHLYLYSPYWLVNNTGLPIQIRGSRSEAIYENDTSEDPLLFRFKAHRRKKAKLKVYNSKWTHSFPLDTVGTSGVIICHDKERNRKYQFLLNIQLSSLRLTKIVTIMPYFVIVNNTVHDLRYMEEDEQADLWLDITPQQCVPFWPVTDSYRMSVKYRESNVCSAHFDVSKSHQTVLRMDRGTALCVEVVGGTDTSVTITLLPYDHGDAPVRMENLCDDVFIKLHQKNQSQVSLLSPNQSVLYTWDNPSTERTLMWNVYNRKKPSYPAFIAKDGFGKVALSILTIKNMQRVTDNRNGVEDSTDDEDSEVESSKTQLVKNTRMDKVTVYWVSYLDRLQRVLLFTQDERVAKKVRKVNEAEQAKTAVFLSLSGIGMSLINGRCEEVAYVTLSSSAALWEVEMRNKWKTLNMELASWLEEQWSKNVTNVTLEDVMQADLQHMEMKKPFVGALRRVYNPALWVQYRQSEHHTYLHARVHRLQIDNQLTDAYFPTVLFPTPLPSYAVKKAGPRPFIEMIVARHQVPEQNIDTFKYVKVLLQELSLQLDKGFILSLLDIFSGQQQAQKESAQLQADLTVARRSLRDLAAVQVAAKPQRILFEYLHLSPIKLMLSFSLDGRIHRASKPDSISADIIEFFLTSVGATITEMKDVELKMAFFERQGVLLTFDQLASEAKGHYILQAVQQAYVFVLGLDVLGNPYGLVKDFTKGLGDFFYEPMVGTIQGPDKIAENLVRGVQSLMGHTIGSMAGSVSLITGSLGKTLAVLSFDSDYRKRRRQYMQQHPAHLPQSFYLAGRGFVMGVALGLSGVIVHPFRGAQEEGVEGFFKGVGKGLLGLITKPPGGTVDMVSMAFDGIRRAAEMGEDVIIRMRLPRYISPYMGLKPYSPYQAVGMRMLNNVAKGKFAKSDIYWAHAALNSDDRADVALVSDKRVLLLGRCKCWGDWDVEMDVPLEDIMAPPAVTDNRLVFRVREGAGFNLITSGERAIASDDHSVLLWLQKKIEKAMNLDL